MFKFFKNLKKEKEVDGELLRLSNHIDMIINENIISNLIEEAKQKNCTYLEILLFLKEDIYDKPFYINNRLKTTLLENNKMYLNYNITSDSEIVNQDVYLCAYTIINVSSKMFEERSKWCYETNLWKSIPKVLNGKYKNTDFFFEIDMDLDDEIENIDYLFEALEMTDLKSTFNCPTEGLFEVPCISIIFQPNKNNQW